MTTSGIDLLIVPDFFDPATVARVRGVMRETIGIAATVYGSSSGGAVQTNVRRTTRISVPDAIAAHVAGALLARKPQVEAYFHVTLNDCEEPQFLRYAEGDFFVAHQDGNTPLLHDERSLRRKISAVVFLSDPDDYAGGALVFHTLRERRELRGDPGSLVLFRAETTHEVTPLIRGERLSIACWYR